MEPRGTVPRVRLQLLAQLIGADFWCIATFAGQLVLNGTDLLNQFLFLLPTCIQLSQFVFRGRFPIGQLPKQFPMVAAGRRFALEDLHLDANLFNPATAVFDGSGGRLLAERDTCTGRVQKAD